MSEGRAYTVNVSLHERPGQSNWRRFPTAVTLTACGPLKLASAAWTFTASAVAFCTSPASSGDALHTAAPLAIRLCIHSRQDCLPDVRAREAIDVSARSFRKLNRSLQCRLEVRRRNARLRTVARSEVDAHCPLLTVPASSQRRPVHSREPAHESADPPRLPASGHRILWSARRPFAAFCS